MMKKTLLVVAIALVLAFDVIALFGTENFNPRIEAFYQIPDYEKDICMKYGGKDAPDTSVKGESSFISEITIAIQASKQKEPDNRTLYEISYYVETFLRDATYIVQVKNKLTGETKKIVEKEEVFAHSGKSGFQTFYDAADWDYAEIRYTEQGDSEKKIRVEFVEKKPQRAARLT
ncbi:MAG TPA: hypothetical protein VJI46_01740 [Candidatus Nanoarchaeia archaeon]|nr:hypothetical protein [Candidatus Nanoarchaeia archaeon]